MVNLVRCTSTLPHRARNPASELSSTINRRPSLISTTLAPSMRIASTRRKIKKNDRRAEKRARSTSHRLIHRIKHVHWPSEEPPG